MGALAVVVLGSACGPPPAAPTGPTTYPTGITRVTVGFDGSQPLDLGRGYEPPSISGDGRYVAFDSGSPNLVAGDTNGCSDVFVRDMVSGVTSVVSVASDGIQGNGTSNAAQISADGRYVVFQSLASNLTSEATDGSTSNVFLHDMTTGVTTRITPGVDSSVDQWFRFPAISADGRYVTFVTLQKHLVPGFSSSGYQVYRFDRQTDVVAPVSVASDGTPSNGDADSIRPATMSADGRYVAFDSDATNLAPHPTRGDAYVHDMVTGTTTKVSVASDGTAGNDLSSNARISADGTAVVFWSWSTNLVPGERIAGDIFVHDLVTGQTTQADVSSDGAAADGIAEFDDISGDGRSIAFMSTANNLVAGDTNGSQDLFVHDRVTGQTTRVPSTVQPDQQSGTHAISSDGRHVTFWTSAANMVPGDTDGGDDLFVADLDG